MSNIINSKEKYGRENYLFVLYLLIILLILTIIFSFLIGRYEISLNDFLNTINKLIFDKNNVNPIYYNIVFKIRFPRIFLAILVGASLSVSGAIYQSLFQNPMASPDILGCTNGAAAGAALAILFGFSKLGITFISFLFSLITIFLVYFIGNRALGNRTSNLILSGIIISSIFSSITSYIKLIADSSDKLPAITYWLMGSLSGFTNNEIPFVLIPIIIILFFVYLLRWQLNLLSLGEEEAMSMGVNVKIMRLLFIIFATILTAVSVAFSGSIAYVGLVIPHFSRKLIGNNNLYLIPISGVLGALFLLIVDNISRNLLSTEIPIGILTSIIGAPFFLYLISRKEGRQCSM